MTVHIIKMKVIRMKFICFTESLAAGGAQRHLVNLAVQFSKRGHDVIFLVYRKNDFFANILHENKIPIVYLSNSNWIERLLSAKKFLHKEKPDVIISFLETPNFISNFASMFKHKWILITTELSAKETTFMGVRGKIFLFFQRFSDAIISNSKNAEKKWELHCPKYKGKLSTIYNPTSDLSLEYESIFSGEKNDIKNIVVPSSYQFLKNPIRVIQAVQALPDSYKRKLHIWWYGKIEPQKGNTKAFDLSKKIVYENGLSEIISLNEETINIFEIMSKADCIGLFSTIEGFPNAICEGMMLKKPILMSTVSDYEFFESSGGLLLCNPMDVDSIKNALISLIDTPWYKLKTMGEKNYEFALQHFSNNVITDAWLNKLYEIKKSKRRKNS